MVLLAILVSYLIGSVPFAYVIGRLVKGIDIRRYGSGNVGATNIFRVVGPGWGIIVFILDLFKGLLCVTFLANSVIPFVSLSPIVLRVLIALASICGHNWTIFLRFKGGKGVATTLGVLAGLGIEVYQIRIIFLFVIMVWLLIFIISRIVSLASIISAASIPIFTALFYPNKEFLVAACLIAFFVILRHKNNIQRLMNDQEKPVKHSKIKPQ